MQKPKLSLMSFHLFGMMITFWGLMKKTGNAYGVKQASKELMILRLLITYWGKRVCVLKVVIFLKTKLIEQDTKSFSISNRLRRVLLLIIQKMSKHTLQVYEISHLLPSNSPSIVVTDISLYQMTLTHLKFQASILHKI